MAVTSGPGGGRGIHRIFPKMRRVEGESTGVVYRAKKAGGDIKRKGRPDPYAYFPLNRQKLNRRSVEWASLHLCAHTHVHVHAGYMQCHMTIMWCHMNIMWCHMNILWCHMNIMWLFCCDIYFCLQEASQASGTVQTNCPKCSQGVCPWNEEGGAASQRKETLNIW